MDITRILTELREQRDRIERAIDLLQGQNGASFHPVARAKSGPRAGSRLSPEGRRKISEMMKKRWADRRRRLAKLAK